MAKSIDRETRRRGQAQIRRGRQILSEHARRLKEQQQQRQREVREAEKLHRKQRKHLAAILRRVGAYKPVGGKRITNNLIKRSGSLRRKLRELEKALAGEVRTPGPRITKAVRRVTREREKAAAPKQAPEPPIDKVAEAVRAAVKIASIFEFSETKRRQIVSKAATNPDSMLAINRWREAKKALYHSNEPVRDYSSFDWMLPDDWEDWVEKFPELGYYHDE